MATTVFWRKFKYFLLNRTVWTFLVCASPIYLYTITKNITPTGAGWGVLDVAGWEILDGQTKPNSVGREGYFNVILSSPTLDKGLAALKLAVTSKHSLWCSSDSLMGIWLMADALKACSSPSPNVEMKPRCYTNAKWATLFFLYWIRTMK